MSIIIVQKKAAAGTGVTLTSAPTSGHKLVVAYGWRNGTSVAPPSGFVEKCFAGSKNGDGVAIAEKTSDGSETGSQAFTGSSTSPFIEIFELAHIDVFDKASAGAFGNASTSQPGSNTPAIAEEFFVLIQSYGAGSSHSPFSINSSFILVDEATLNTRGLVAYKIQTGSAVAENPTVTATLGGAYQITMASFKPLVQAGKFKRLLSGVWALKPVKTSAGTTKPLKYLEGSTWQKAP